MRMFFCYRNQKRERWERGEEGKNSKEKEGIKRARQDLIHSLTPDSLASGGNYWQTITITTILIIIIIIVKK